MGGTRWTASEDATIRESFGKMFAGAIAELLPGRTPKSVQHRAKTLGLWMDGETFGDVVRSEYDKEIESRIGESIGDWLRRRYIEEGATYRQLCAELGINTRTVMRFMRENNIEPISPEVAARRQMERNPDAISRMMAPEVQRRRAASLAKTRQANWQTFCSARELELLDALRTAGLNPIPQLAVEGYNIDFAFISARLAVEHDPCWHDTKASDKKRDERLSFLGWTVLRLESRTSLEYNVAKVSSALQSLAATQPR